MEPGTAVNFNELETKCMRIQELLNFHFSMNYKSIYVQDILCGILKCTFEILC